MLGCVTERRIIAVVDIGSNSVRLLVARQLSASAFEVIDEERLEARLGQGQVDGVLTDAAVERGLRALRVMVQIARSYGPAQLIAVGTEALRRASNAEAFLRPAREQTGVPIRVLSVEDEAFFGFLGVMNSTSLRSGHVLDIGGGSLELMTVEERMLTKVRSGPFGAIYATERFFRADPPSARDVRALRKAVRQHYQTAASSPILFASGGAVRNLARIVRLKKGYPLRRLHGLSIDRRDLHRLASTLVHLDSDGRRRLPGMSGARLEILPAAAVVIDELMDITGAKSVTVAGQGLREGLVWQQLRDDQPMLANVRGASIEGLAIANGIDSHSAEPVVSAAARIFEETLPVHGYGEFELELLLSAARLAGIGMHIDYYSRDRHAEYLVHSGDLHGFSHREIVLLAALVRWSSSGSVDLTEYRRIVEPADQARANVLAAMLGVAQAVSRRLPSPVFTFEVGLGKSGVRLRLSGGDPLDAEQLALERQQRRFESALKVPVSIDIKRAVRRPPSPGAAPAEGAIPASPLRALPRRQRS